MARAARGGLSTTQQRAAEAALRQRDSAAARNFTESAHASPFSRAAYQAALDTATRFALGDCQWPERCMTLEQTFSTSHYTDMQLQERQALGQPCLHMQWHQLISSVVLLMHEVREKWWKV